MSSPGLPDLPCGRSSLLTPADVPAVFHLYRRCSDYFLLQDGEPASRSDAETLFTDVPSSKSADDQCIVGSWKQSNLFVLAQVLTDYPAAGDRYLGFLLLDPSLRGHGVGRQTYLAIERWSFECGALRMLVAVLQENEPALRFWQSLGFEQLQITGPTRYKSKEHVVLELAKPLPSRKNDNIHGGDAARRRHGSAGFIT